MIIKKFTAKDSRSVLAQVRQEFGPDAILLSSKTVDDQFEMVASPGYSDQEIEKELSGEAEEIRLKELEKLREQERRYHQEMQREKDRQRELENQAREDRVRQSEIMEQMRNTHQQSIESMQEEMARLRELMEIQIQANSKSQVPHIERIQIPNNQIISDQVSRKTEDPSRHIDRALAQIGMSKQLRSSLKKRLEGVNRMDVASTKIMKMLSSAVKEMPMGTFPESGLAVFVGQAKSGKTTALIKIAQEYRRKYDSTSLGLVMLGNLRKNSGLKKYAAALNINYIEAKSELELLSAVKSFSEKKLVLIDSQGMLEPNMLIKNSLRTLRKRHPSLLTFLTIPADSQPEKQEKIADSYLGFQPSILISMMDRPKYLGFLVELLIRKKIPLSYISKTKKLDGDIALGKSEQLIKEALCLGKLPEEQQLEQKIHYGRNMDLAS